MIAPLPAAVPLSGPPPCAARDLRPFKGMLQGATGSMDGVVHVHNVSRRRCALGGRPSVRIAVPGGRVFATKERAFAPSGTGGRMVTTLGRGQAAVLHLDWSNWCGSWAGRAGSFRRLELRVTLTTGRRLTLPLLSGRPRCDRPHSPSMLFVSAFATA